MNEPALLLRPAAGGFSAEAHYVLTTLLVALGVPHREEQDVGVLLWPENEGEARLEIVVDAAAFEKAFTVLARLEEWELVERDEHGRFPFRVSDLAIEPACSVDGAMADLANAISGALRQKGVEWHRKPAWPQDAPFAVCLTHDIDWTRKWSVRSVVSHLARNSLRVTGSPWQPSGWRALSRDLRSARQRENPYWCMPEIALREKEYGFRSTFFFLAGRYHAKDGDYAVADPQIAQLIGTLEDDGFEIGLHGSYGSFDRPEFLARELEQLRSIAGSVVGGRQHYLRFDIGTTLTVYEKLGLRYDSTMGFAERDGYRAGVSYPFFPYHVAENRPFRVLEIPLTVMDATLFQYRKLGAVEAWQAVRRHLEYARDSGGCCTLLWHNTYFDDADYPGYGDVYWRALRWTAENGGWGASASQVWEWWQRRTKDCVVVSNQGAELLTR